MITIKNATARQITPFCWDVILPGETPKGETVHVSLCKCIDDPKSKRSLPALWKKHGVTPKRLSTWWAVDCDVYQPDGSCWGRYNPQVIPGQSKINFKWMLPATQENAMLILAEVVRLANGGKAE